MVFISAEQKNDNCYILEISANIPVCYQSTLLDDHSRFSEFKQTKHVFLKAKSVMKYFKRPLLSNLNYTRKIISYLLYFITYFHSIERVIYTTLFTIIIPLQLILLLNWAKCDIPLKIQYSYSNFVVFT